MQVQSLECQLAQAQIGRYLSGAAFSGEALTQLEKHISACETCKTVVDERRSTLRSMLSAKAQPTPPAKAVVQHPVAERASALLGLFAKKTASPDEGLSVQQAMEPNPAPGQFWKPLIYSGGLAALLIAMSFMSRSGPTGVFGKRAIDMTPAASAPVATATTAAPTPPSEASAAAKEALAAGLLSSVFLDAPTAPESSRDTVAEEISTEPPRTTRRFQSEPDIEVRRRPLRSRTDVSTAEAERPRKKRKPAADTPVSQSTGVKVYDENGNPISN